MLPRTLCAQIRFLQNGNSQLLRLSARSLSAKAEKPVIPTPLPIATPSSLPSSVEEPPKGFTGKIKTIFKKYGYIAIALYSGAYLTQFGVATGIFMEYDNLGLSIADLMPEGRVGKYMPSFVHVPTDTGISSTHLSVVLAWVTTEMAEPIRLPLVLALSPLVRKALDRRRAAAGEK